MFEYPDKELTFSTWMLTFLTGDVSSSFNDNACCPHVFEYPDEDADLPDSDADLPDGDESLLDVDADLPDRRDADLPDEGMYRMLLGRLFGKNLDDGNEEDNILK